MRRAFLVFNPTAGQFPSQLLCERAATLLRKLDWEIHLERSQDGPDITRLARKAAEEGMDAFFIAGGDGSLNLAVAGLLDTPTALGVLPAGTANVFAQELGLPGLGLTRWMALEESARLLANAPARAVDVGMCNGLPFLLWAGVGLDGFVIHQLEPRSRWQKYFAGIHYAASVFWNATQWKGMDLQAKVDGEEISGHFLLALASNIHLYAGGMAQLSPNARLDDGLLDLWLFKGENLGDTVQRVWDLFAGRHMQSDKILSTSFRELQMRAEPVAYLQLDAEPVVSGSTEVTIQVRPLALQVLVPEPTPHLLFTRSAE